jgi:hypothetical protein
MLKNERRTTRPSDPQSLVALVAAQRHRRSRRGILASILGAVLAAIVGLSPVAAAPAAAAETALSCSLWSSSSTYYSVLNPGGSRKVIGIDRGLLTNRARAILSDYHGDPNQLWVDRVCLVPGYGYAFHQFKNAKSGLCLDKSLDSPEANGNIVHQYTCATTLESGYNQLWRPWTRGGSSGNWRQLINVHSQRCLDIHNRSLSNGAGLVQWDCAPDSAPSNTQQWNIV